MPTDANGNYTLPTGYLAVTGQTIEASQHNPPLEDLAASMSQRIMASGAKPMTGALKLVDGTVAVPGLVFNSAQTTGWYKTPNGWGFAVGGALVFELTANGAAKGSRYIGELISLARTSVPALCVLPVGQNLPRADYPDLWALAQIEIANGNTMYNSGNGSTTFGILDCRGCTLVARDNMGGSPSNRLIGASVVSGDRDTLGSLLGAATHALTGAQNGPHGHNIIDPGHAHTYTTHTNLFGGPGGGGNYNAGEGPGSTGSNTTGITIVSAGNGDAHNNTQPSRLVHFALFAGA